MSYVAVCQALQRHGALLGRQLREREDELAQAKSAAERVTVAEARAQVGQFYIIYVYHIRLHLISCAQRLPRCAAVHMV